MNLRTKLIAAVFTLTALAPLAARADDCDYGVHEATSVTPSSGHYETRSVQTWVPGYYESVYVPICRTGWRGQTRCHSGYSQQVFRPGHYENTSQQVWVADTYYAPTPPPVYQYQAPAPPPVYYRHEQARTYVAPRVSFRVGMHF